MNTKTTETAISVKNVKKSFKVHYDKGNSLKEVLLFKKRRRFEIRTVLNDISFDIKKGEAVGIIGHNGCGKSTLLKMLTRIMYPDSGSIEIKGRVSSLIELGAGFHPDMSGRENIYTNAAIFGLTKNEIDQRLQRIIDFSGIEPFIDNPVRTYSSGMYMRLAFAVAINVDAAVLLIDEILAVGDTAFQAKCLNKLREIKAQGTTVVIVSHSLGQIEQLCDRTIWIDEGVIRIDGKPRNVHPEYMEYMSTIQKLTDSATTQQTVQEEEQPPHTEEVCNEPDKTKVNNENNETEGTSVYRWGNKDICIERVYLIDEKGLDTASLISGRSASIIVEYKKNKPVDQVSCGFGIFRNDDVQCYGTNTDIDRIDLDLESNRGIVEIYFPSVDLLAGQYSLDIAFHKTDGFAYDYCRKILDFSVTSLISDVGISRMSHTWKNRSR